MRYFVRFSYVGTDFHGSQTQPNAITVQQTMEEVFSTVLRQPVALTFAGRTDAGVHATHMVAHFDYNEQIINLKSKILNINSILPQAIAVDSILPVNDDAHARFSATARTYEYRITTRKDPFRQHLVTRVAPGLDFAAMNRAAAYLLGTHDFASFCRTHTDVKTTLCSVSEAQWFPNEDATEAVFRITADRFLRNMVRAIVGTLFEVGRGKRSPEDILAILSAHSRPAAGQSAPADGLFLTCITYP